MKKGLLSLLAVALTVVGCQNYDDQFDDLKTQITDLATTVAGLTQVQSDLDDLSDDVSQLSTALGNIPTTDSVADLTTTLSNQAAIIDSLRNVLQSSALTQAQLAQVSATLALVQADVQTLLQGDSVISPASGGLIITNEAQLLAAENLVPSDADPATIVLDGFLDVRVGTGFLTTQGQLDRANAVLGKLATVIGTVDISNSPTDAQTGDITADGLASAVGTVTLRGDDAPGLSGLVSVGGALYLQTTENPTLAALTSVGGDFERLSGGKPVVAALRTVGGDLNARHTGDWDYSQVTSVGGDAIVPDNAESINLTGVTVGGDIINWITGTNSLGSVGVLTQTASTTGAINLGTAGINTVTADSASSVEGAVTSLTSLDIDADAASYIHFNAATAATGNINIDAATSTIVRFDQLASAGNITITDSTNSHLERLATATGTLQISAESTVDLRALTAVYANSSIGGETVLLNALATATGTLTLPDATSVTFPEFNADNSVVANSATALTLKSIAATNLAADAATSLTLSDQDETFTLTDARRVSDLGALTSLNITGTDGDSQNGVVTHTVDVTAAATLTSVTIAGKFDSATVSGAGVTSLSTSGYITDLTVNGTGVTALDLNHDYIGLDTAVTVVVTNNTSLATIDLADVDKVKTVTATGNTSLTSVIAPAAVYPEAGADINLTITGADLAATYTEGVTGTVVTQTVPAQPAEAATLAVSADIEGLLDWFDAASANSSTASSVAIAFSNITYVDRVRDTTDGSISNTTSTTVYTSFGNAVAADSYTTALGTTNGNANLDTTPEKALVIRN